jgi:hypothetical protein
MSAEPLPTLTDLDIYATASSRYALLVMHKAEGYGWLRRRGFPAFWCRKRGGFLARPEDVLDLVTMARFGGVRVTEHHARGPREASIRRRHATRTTTRRRSA